MSNSVSSRLVAFLILLQGAWLMQAAPVLAGQLARRAELLELHYLHHTPSLGLAQVYRHMSQPQRVALAGKLQELVVSKVPPGIENHPALANLSPAMKEMVKRLSELAHHGTPEQVEQLIAAQDLDHLAPIPAPVLRLYHDFVLNAPIEGSGRIRKEVLATDVASPAWKQELAATSGYVLPDDGPAVMEMLTSRDPVPAAEVPKDTTTPALQGAVVVASLVVRYPDHALVNSVRLARALNLLMRPASAGPVTLKLGNQTFSVDTPEALLRTFVDKGDYEVGVFDARMFVNFLDYSVQRLGAPLPIRIPTWAATDIETAPGKNLLVPICHTEHIMVLFRKGQTAPEAMVRWFLAMPDSAKQGTLFRPAIFRRWAWSGWRVVRAYDGLAPAQRLVSVAHRVMQAFNYQQEKYRFPGRAYGLLGVCNDTTGILELAMQGSADRVTAWPLVRDPRFDMYLASALGDLGFASHTAGGLTVLELPCDTRPDLNPQTAQPASLMRRIGANIPAHELCDLQFRDLAAALEELLGKYPELKEGLSMRPDSAR